MQRVLFLLSYLWLGFTTAPKLHADEVALKAIIAVQQAQIAALAHRIGPNCDDGKLSVDKKFCYKRFIHPANFNEADRTCVLWGGRLTSIGDEAERNLVISLMPSANWTWIGLTDDGNQGTYRWVDGTPFGYSSFVPGEPNHAGGEFCVVSGHGWVGWWNDISCSYPVPAFICKKSMQLP